MILGKPAVIATISRGRSTMKLNGHIVNMLVSVPTRSGGVDCVNMHPFPIPLCSLKYLWHNEQTAIVAWHASHLNKSENGGVT